MELIEYIKSFDKAGLVKFAVSCHTSAGHLKNVAYGYKPCGIALAVAVEAGSGGVVSRKQLRPDDWQKYWPELVNQSTSKQEAQP